MLVSSQYIVLALKTIFAIITCIYFSQISALIYIIMEHFNGADANLPGQLKLTHSHIFVSILIMDINIIDRCQGMAQCQS